MFSIVHITPGHDGKAPGLDADTRRVVRSHAMRHYRREQKNARNRGKGSRQPLMPASLTKVRDMDNRTSSEGKDDKDCSDRKSTTPDDTGRSQDLLKMNSRSDISGWQCSTEIPRLSNGATFYRYMLHEMFGASLTGDHSERPHSAGKMCYRGYVTTTKSDLVVAIDDAVCLLLPACSLASHRILLEARRRHLAGVQFMRKVLQNRANGAAHSMDIIAMISAASEIIFIDMFKPFTVGYECLYGGLVHLLRSNWIQLTTFRGPGPVSVTLFLLFAMQQIMLMASLEKRVAMPIGPKAWQDIPHASGTRAEITESLMVLAIHVPGLLETTEIWLQNVDQNHSDIKSLLAGVLSLETRLIQWQKEWCAETIDTVTFSYLAKASDDSTVPGRWDVPRGTQELRNMPFLGKQCLTLCCICLLLLQESTASLSAALKHRTSTDRYTARARWTADRLCDLAGYFIVEEEGLLSKALSVCPALHFAHQWYERNNDREGAAAAKEQELRVRQEVPFLSWQSMLPLSLVSMYMVG